MSGLTWLYLAIAISSEVAATSALKLAEGFTRPVPSMVVIAGYALAFYFLSLTLRDMPVGVAYAVWSGAGIALVSLIAWIIYNQTLGAGELAGIGLIMLGVVVLNVFSKTAH
ncbi:DMT family transporter [Methylocapsa palsarum]|uniref:Small multidrug resistance pump n=1 Tax=Methylocapsa palsarum TaxID=1612308 RepID=A0A1I3VVX3_9HYPH|nr:multidrug efflux SMR transporter [Methylocapsa palsarum]SFJ99385.1 small multidrug resistance pump [Methylocapsa palsarum]